MPRIGEELAGRYRLDALIGSGGFAAVYRARDLRLDRDVAVKVLLANHATDPMVATRFDQEARTLAAVSHPNVIAIHDHDPGDPGTGAEPFLVMDLGDGGSLADRLDASGTGALAPNELVPILVEVAAGLDALHSRGIVHRDLKPPNILLLDGRAQIADLGIAAVGLSELTEAGTTIGTLAYMAPEQVTGAPASPAGDVYALGTIAFLGLTGTLPRPAGTYADLVAASARPASLVSALRPDIGSAFDASIARALSVDPASRPTPAEFGSAISTALDRWSATPAAVAASRAPTVIVEPLPEVLPAPEVSPMPAAAGVPPRRGLLAMVGLSFIALGLGVAGFLLVRSLLTGALASPSATPGPSGSAISSVVASPSVSPSPSATTDPFGPARAASDQMKTAITDARGSHGLNGREARELEGLVADFDQALDAADPQTAREVANAIAARVTELIDNGSVDNQGAAELSAAADGLVAAATNLPG